MGVRLTGISTPVGGFSWEYTSSVEKFSLPMMSPGQKIKVFISSICGVERYDKVRSELKSAIEATQLAEVYIFELGQGYRLKSILSKSTTLKRYTISAMKLNKKKLHWNKA